MTNTASQQRRRMTPVREAEIYEVVLGLLKDVGYEALTMDEIAAHTGCSKATLYRWWSGKAELVIRALRHESPDDTVLANTGSLRGDLLALVTREDDHVLERRSALLRSMAMAVYHNPALLEGVRDHLVRPHAAALRCLIQQAIDRGEVASDCPALPFVTEMVLGAVIARTLIDDQPPTRAFLSAYVEAVIIPALGVSAAHT
ncbi:TetR/AcrR family transcriptional regulator [Streptomyces sp. NPDC058086]|uniref:TetR/AcrR family transcriptional regulator n=1 Tax=Streptomyces sp. NPDC058086 TaxID=3346334 RepID=UPI0036F100A2